MFTGIVADIGKVDSLKRTARGMTLSVASKLFSSVNIGDSVAVNGVCLTVVKKEKAGAAFDVISQTLDATRLKNIKTGDSVNLELSLKAGEGISGHFVTGHIDCAGKIKSITRREDEVSIEIEVPPQYRVFLVEKGSIAMDGVSLTVARIKDTVFKAHIIPYTVEKTTLVQKRAGEDVNIEFDILGKYVLKFQAEKADLTEKFLKAQGFI